MRKLLLLLLITVFIGVKGWGQLYFGSTGTWTNAVWSTTGSSPFTTAWTASSNVIFNTPATATFATTSVGNITINDDVTITANGTLTGSGNPSIVTVASGKTLTWISQSWSTSTAAAGSFTKSGAGTWNIGAQGNSTNGTFTLNAGTVIVSGNSSFGGSAASLVINGGTIQSSGNRSFPPSITIGGDFALTGTGNATHSGSVSLGAATRTITNSTSSGSRIFTGVISGTSGSGLTFNGSGSGQIYIGSATNTFTGTITINGAEVGFDANAALGNANNTIVVDGGRLSSATTSGGAVTSTWASTHNIQVGTTTGTSISVVNSAGSLTYNGVISDLTSLGILVKQGAGKLILGGANTYTGLTTINNGTLQLNYSSGNTIPSTNDVTVSSGTLQISSNQTLNNLTVASGGTVIIDNGVTLTVNGTLSINGTISGAGTLTLSNPTLQNTMFGTGSVQNLTINNSNGVVISSGLPVITGVLTLKTGQLTTNGTLVLASSATGTASLAPVDGTINTGTLNGTVTVQRYIPSLNRKKYVLVSSPVGGGITINNGWQEFQGTGNTFTTTAGYGTSITGGVTQGTNGFDGPASSSQSIWTYDDTKTSGTKWTAVANTTDAGSLSPGTGYLLFVRGDRGEDRATTGNSSNTILRATGTLSIGNVPITLNTISNSKYNLIANPYPCAINWTSGITKNNLSSSFTVYDPNLQTFVTSDGTTVSPNTGQQQANVIQSGQAFFIQNAASGTPSIIFTEAAKTTTATTASNTTVFGTGSNGSQLNINIYRASDKSLADGVVALFGSNYSKAVSLEEDASKFTNFNETFAISRSDQNLAIEKRPMVSGTDTLFFSMNNFGKKDYILAINGSNWSSDVAVNLIDNYTHTQQPIDVMAITNYSFSVTADAGSSANNRFIITFSSKQNTAVDNTDNSILVKASPNPVINELTVTSKTAMNAVRLLNTGGIASISQININNTITKLNVSSISAGVYVLEVTDINGKVTVQKIVK